MVKTQHNIVIKCFCCDLGGEYTSNKFSELLAYDSTIHKASCTNTPQQNGMEECMNRHFLDVTHSLLIQASLPSQF